MRSLMRNASQLAGLRVRRSSHSSSLAVLLEVNRILSVRRMRAPYARSYVYEQGCCRRAANRDATRFSASLLAR